MTGGYVICVRISVRSTLMGRRDGRWNADSKLGVCFRIVVGSLSCSYSWRLIEGLRLEALGT